MTMSHPAESTAPLVLDGAALTLEDVLAVAQRRRGIALSPCPEFRARIERGQRFLAQLLEEDGVVYGVTTGYGDACTRPVAHDDIDDLPRQLYTFHGCGMARHSMPRRPGPWYWCDWYPFARACRESVSSCWSASHGCWNMMCFR